MRTHRSRRTALRPRRRGCVTLDDSRNSAGFAAVVLATFAFSWGFILVKAVRLPAATTACLRLAISAVVLGCWVLLARPGRPSRIGPVFGAGVCFGVHQLLYVPAAQLTSIAIVTVVASLQPLVVSLLAHRFLRERVPLGLVLWSLVAILAVALVVSGSYDDDSRSLLGDVLSGFNLFAFTGYFLFAKRARDQGTPTLTLTWLVALIALGVVLAFVALISLTRSASVAATPLGPGTLELPRFAWQWLLLAILAVGPANGHLLLNWAHPRVTAAFASLVLSSVPLWSAIWARIVFGEAYGPRHVIGMVLAACAIEGGRRIEQRRLAQA